LALASAAICVVYGVFAYATRQRPHESAMSHALGAGNGLFAKSWDGGLQFAGLGAWFSSDDLICAYPIYGALYGVGTAGLADIPFMVAISLRR